MGLEFSIKVSEFVKGTNEEIEKARRAITLALFRSVIMDTPVLTGRLRGNWITSVNNPTTSVVERIDKSGAIAIGEVQNNLGQLGDVVWMSNNLPYARRIEYEGWSHTKAPQGMVRKNVVRIARNLKKHVAN